jgi:integrase
MALGCLGVCCGPGHLSWPIAVEEAGLGDEVATGLRRAELLGLRWSDVDLPGACPYVRLTLQRSGPRLEFVPPKAHRSARPIPLCALATRALELQRVRQAKERLAAGALWHDHGLVFASTIGTPLEPRNVNRRFEQLRHPAGLDWLHLHDLRHAFAMFLLDQGEELRRVMKLLGHSTIRITADTYGHVLPARARLATTAIDRILGRAPRETATTGRLSSARSCGGDR